MTGTPLGSPQGPKAGPPRSDEGGPSVATYAGHGLTFAVSVLLFLKIGEWLDRKLGTSPWLLLIGVFLGAGASFYSMYRSLMAAQAREEAARRARREEDQARRSPP
jgi:hypothetical protein